MQQLIEQLAHDAGTTYDETQIIFAAIYSLLITKIPALAQVIEDVFENAEAEKLKTHIRKLIILLEEQQCREAFGASMLPQWNETKHREQSNELF